MRISATDIDDGMNSALQYDLSPRVPQDSNFFRIDQNTGVIYLDHLIDVSMIYTMYKHWNDVQNVTSGNINVFLKYFYDMNIFILLERPRLQI